MTTKKLGIIELLTGIGEDKIQVQNIVESLGTIKKRKDGISEVSFFTDQINPNDIMQDGGDKIGLIVWLPKDAVNEVIKRRKT